MLVRRYYNRSQAKHVARALVSGMVAPLIKYAWVLVWDEQTYIVVLPKEGLARKDHALVEVSLTPGSPVPLESLGKKADWPDKFDEIYGGAAITRIPIQPKA